MTPVAMNPPSPFLLTDQIEDQHQHFVSPLNQDSSSNSSLSSRPTFFHLLDQVQTARETRSELRHDQDQEDGLVFHGGSSSHHQVCNPSFNSPHQTQQVKEYRRNVCGGYEQEEKEESNNKSSYETVQWMPAKMRLMKKMMIPNNTSPVPKRGLNITPIIQTREHHKTQTQKSPCNNYRNNTTTTARVCADCNTTSTPLWRGGPKGPKSLCNACGIRQRKARRALMAETGSGAVSCRLNSKENKKARTNHFIALKNNNNKCKVTIANTSEGTLLSEEGERNKKKNIGFKNLAFSFRNNVSVVEQVFPPADEVAQAALLLMDLSYASVPV